MHLGCFVFKELLMEFTNSSNKPTKIFINDYHYFKMKGYNIVTQVIIDYNKKFIDVFGGYLLFYIYNYYQDVTNFILFLIA